MNIDIKKIKKNPRYKKKYNFFMIILALISILSFIIISKMIYFHGDLEEKEDISKLVLLESKDIAIIEKNILAIREELKPKDNSGESVDVKVAFSNTIFMGDSISEGLSEYEILNPSSVMAIKGRNVLTAIDDIDTISNLNPSNIVMFYGMNDMLLFNDASEFVKGYEELVDSIKKKLPNAKIFINSVFPTTDAASSREPGFNKYSDFNIALEEMCTRLGIEYMDTSYIVKENPSLYEQDGIHMVYSFYPQWLDVIRERVGV